MPLSGIYAGVEWIPCQQPQGMTIQMVPSSYPVVVFCDFDGTITEKDMVATLCKKFCPPGAAEAVIKQILDKTITVKKGVADLFAMIPSSEKQAMLAYGQEVLKFRSGFQSFLEWCKANQWRFIVCSGGIDFFIEPMMKPFAPFIERVVSIPSDFSGPHIRLRHNYACETCGTCKVKVMGDYPGTTHLLIGDGITDLHGARSADRVFARNGLQRYLDEEKIRYDAFETFDDILKILRAS